MISVCTCILHCVVCDVVLSADTTIMRKCGNNVIKVDPDRMIFTPKFHAENRITARLVSVWCESRRPIIKTCADYMLLGKYKLCTDHMWY